MVARIFPQLSSGDLEFKLNRQFPVFDLGNDIENFLRPLLIQKMDMVRILSTDVIFSNQGYVESHI